MDYSSLRLQLPDQPKPSSCHGKWQTNRNSDSDNSTTVIQLRLSDSHKSIITSIKWLMVISGEPLKLIMFLKIVHGYACDRLCICVPTHACMRTYMHPYMHAYIPWMHRYITWQTMQIIPAHVYKNSTTIHYGTLQYNAIHRNASQRERHMFFSRYAHNIAQSKDLMQCLHAISKSSDFLLNLHDELSGTATGALPSLTMVTVPFSKT